MQIDIFYQLFKSKSFLFFCYVNVVQCERLEAVGFTQGIGASGEGSRIDNEMKCTVVSAIFND